MACRVEPDPVIVNDLEAMCKNPVELRWNFPKGGWDLFECGGDGRWRWVDHVFPYEFNRTWLEQMRRSDITKPWFEAERDRYANQRQRERADRDRRFKQAAGASLAEVGEAASLPRAGRRDDWLSGYQRQLESDFGESHDSDSG